MTVPPDNTPDPSDSSESPDEEVFDDVFDLAPPVETPKHKALQPETNSAETTSAETNPAGEAPTGQSSPPPIPPSSTDARAEPHAAGRTDHARLVALLRKHDVFRTRSAGLLLLLGVAWCAVMVLILSFFIYLLIVVPVFDTTWLPFVVGRTGPCCVTVMIVAAVVLPLLFWREKRARGEFMRDATGLEGAMPTSSLGSRFPLKLQALAFAELLLTGPRWILQGLGQRQERLGDTRVLNKAAELLAKLRVSDRAISAKKLVGPDEDMPAFAAAIEYLVKHDWAGRSTDASKIWISSEAKRRMAAARESA